MRMTSFSCSHSVTETTTMETTLSNETTADHSTSNEAADADTRPDDDAADPSPDTAAADNAPAATEGGDTDDQVLLDRLAQREERRKKRGAWGMRRHAATVEATAYRLVRKSHLYYYCQ